MCSSPPLPPRSRDGTLSRFRGGERPFTVFVDDAKDSEWGRTSRNLLKRLINPCSLFLWVAPQSRR